MIKRLPRFAEVKLQSLCAKAGVLCHKVDEDESGWDFLVEFPAKAFKGPADTHPPAPSAYVQVKSTRNGRLTCRLKLSNALRAAQSPHPWFIMLVRPGARGKPEEVYVVHVWADLIQRTLKAVRQAENNGKRLNRCQVAISLGASDKRGPGLLRWMRKSIEAITPEYEVAKRQINQTVGYEEGYGEGKMTIEANTEAEIFAGFLGLGDGLRLSRFTFTPSRFGLPSPSPELDIGSGGIVRITPHPSADIELRLHSSTAARTIVLPGKVYGLSLPGMPKEQRRLRFSAGFLEIVWCPDSEAECFINFDPNEKRDLKFIENFLTFKACVTEGPIDLQIWSGGKRAVGFTLSPKDTAPLHQYGEVAATISMLRSIAGPIGEERVSVSLNDLVASSGLKTFFDISREGPFRVEFSATLPAEPKCTDLLYWFHVDVGEYAFYSLVERSVVEDLQTNGTRCVTAGPAKYVEAYVLTKPTRSDRKIMRKDYERHLARLDEKGLVLGLGDLRGFLASTTPKLAA